MARRVVILGPTRDVDGERVIHAAEITPLDAEAFLSNQHGTWRVCLSRLGGPLADATVIWRDPVKWPWQAQPDESSTKQRAEDIAWEACMAVCPEAKPFTIPAPIPVAA